MKLPPLVMALAVLAVVSMDPGYARAAAQAQAEAKAPINLNTATLSQLETLPGVGPQTAARIKEYRDKNGGFKKVEDLMKIKGIGEKAFLKLRGLVTIGAPATQTSGNSDDGE